MKIIKLSATNSTNSFLKELSQTSALKNYTCVVTKNQLEGRGQMGATWQSEAGKNLLFSVFVKFNDLKIDQQSYLNFAVSLAIFNTLNNYKIPKLSIKWPNDILSANKKLCGILIENTLKTDKIDSTIIGIGLNVNQQKFSNDLSKATSLTKILKKELNLDELLNEILLEIKHQINILISDDFQILKENYLKVLYRINTPSMFKDQNNNQFMGIVKDISKTGKLCVQLEDDSIKEFEIKEITFI
ncbi:BirA family biotin operon repressor/biotin-[acetyl-CoA-carboxylase] ligase [Lutibacter sp. Hel_I_33_5]|uniref:biotin--[acetyl-CoA-carboxylase] ligase n=1 Tax=Lutibacter sp. Hel_I_33_5 TaxID=1566289 RepID=UPI0011A0B847|nr:biotin--[acetyl-CoA-carboxylase] ligase [Lutibacter sp. Hel_I_33_5]TVZ57091.1 BirA family biotin operon repressor/biotin-[acetyl-CoA-carboxylase] ligase [Lutibacter sp. Hel_I_33_5]